MSILASVGPPVSPSSLLCQHLGHSLPPCVKGDQAITVLSPRVSYLQQEQFQRYLLQSPGDVAVSPMGLGVQSAGSGNICCMPERKAQEDDSGQVFV